MSRGYQLEMLPIYLEGQIVGYTVTFWDSINGKDKIFYIYYRGFVSKNGNINPDDLYDDMLKLGDRLYKDINK